MKVVVTSVGERTTPLSKWALERLGFEVLVLQEPTSLWEKLKYIYDNVDEDFLRVDADVICNKNVLDLVRTIPDGVWWYQASVFDWYRQDVGQGGINFIRKEALGPLRARISEFRDAERPETEAYRIREFYDPRRCETSSLVCGVHGYGQGDIKRVKAVKERRGQMANYDFELAQKMNELGDF